MWHQLTLTRRASFRRSQQELEGANKMSDDPQVLQVGRCQMMKAENGRISKAHTKAEDGFTVRYLTREAGDGVTCGFVFIDPCEFDYTMPMDETIYVIEGA